jgi:aryl-alcohol dehydrogenase-like predicted oxidoreductase
MQTATIGNKTIPALGIGTWAWGDKLFWNYGKDYGAPEVKAAFDAAVEAGITFFDTAEIYGSGESERLLGQFAKKTSAPLYIATKYFPFPWRFGTQVIEKAIDDSLDRLQVKCIDLYQIHWPLHFLIPEKTLLQTLVKAVKQGKIASIGVSNYSADQMRRAHQILADLGVPLVSNQVNYSLLVRKIESNGVLETAKELGIAIIAYSPLAQGLLTGKYKNTNPPTGARQLDTRFGAKGLDQIQPLLRLMNDIAAQQGKTCAQVALNWTIRKGTIPIPGAKNAQQALQNAGALGWELTDTEMAQLDRATRSFL